MIGKLKIEGFEKLNYKAGIIAYDTEGTGLNPFDNSQRHKFFPARPFLYSFCDIDGNQAHVRWPVNPFTREVLFDKKGLSIIKTILEDKRITKIGHNLNYDYKMSYFSGINQKGPIEDTIIMTHIATGGKERSYGLKPISKSLMDYPDDDEKILQASAVEMRRYGKSCKWCLATPELFGKDFIKADYWLAKENICLQYALKDAERTMLLYLGFRDKVNNDTNLKKVYEREKILFWVVLAMELRGVKIFREKENELLKFYEDYKSSQKIIADQNGGSGLNFRSHPQKSKIFYKKEGYIPIYFTPKGEPSTNGDSLIYFSEKYQDKLAKAIIEHNGADHMITAFIKPYEKFRVLENSDWIIHPNFRQIGPITGRFSCSDPNLMQVAADDTGRKKAGVALRIRELFGPRKNYIWYLPDYSQIEVWVFSFLSGEESLTQPLLKGEDFHESVAKQIWGELPDYEENKKHYRKRAKLLMFSKLYGGGVNKIAYLMETTSSEARNFVDDFNYRIPGVERYMNRLSNQAVREGKIVNPFGRTYFIDPQFSYRAVNYMVQGTSADILKESMIRIHNLFQKKWKDCHILLTIHDELVLEIPLKFHSKKLMREIISAMQTDSHIISCPIPLPVGMKIAKERWSNCIEIKSLQEEWKNKYLCSKNFKTNSEGSKNMALSLRV